MVFANKKIKSTNHNRLNLRDTSTEPTNLFGDQNLASNLMRSTDVIRMPENNKQDSDNDDELNDRVEESVTELPTLDNVHVPNHERRYRATLGGNTASKGLTTKKETHHRESRNSLHAAAANVLNEPSMNS